MADFSKKKDGELIKELVSKRTALKDFRFAIWGSKTRNTKEGRDLKREIAQILTEISHRKKTMESSHK
jgi:ribosomal protein L29